MTLVSLQMTGSDQITENINAFFTSDVGTNSEQSDGSDAVMQMQSFQLKESPGPKQYSMGMLTSLLQPTSINCMRMSRSSVERVLSRCMNTSKRIHYRHYYNYSESNNHTIPGSSTLHFTVTVTTILQTKPSHLICFTFCKLWSHRDVILTKGSISVWFPVEGGVWDFAC